MQLRTCTINHSKTEHYGDFLVTLCPRPHKHNEYFVAFVSFQELGTVVWNYLEHCHNQTIATLVETNMGTALRIGTDGEIHQILPLAFLEPGNTPDSEEQLRITTDLKEEIAKQLHLKPVWSHKEHRIREARHHIQVNERMRTRSEQQMIEKEARKKEAKEREHIVTELLGRPQFYVITEHGLHLKHAVPIVSATDKWVYLPENTLCVDVTWYDSVQQISGEAQYAFKVTKRYGGMEQTQKAKVLLAGIPEQ